MTTEELHVYHGTLDFFFETGTEGPLLVLIEAGFEGLDALRFINQGDQLTVYDADNAILFDGEVFFDINAPWGQLVRPDTPLRAALKSREDKRDEEEE